MNDGFRFPSAGPQVLVHSVTMDHHDSTIMMRSGGAQAGGYITPNNPSMDVTFKVTLREANRANDFLSYVREYGSQKGYAGYQVQTAELEDNRRLMVEMVEAEKDMRIQLERLSDQVAEMRWLTDSYKAKNTAMERELLLMSCLSAGDEEATERVAEAAVRSWVISLQEEGEFGREEILDLVNRVGLLLKRVEAAKLAEFKTTDVIVEGVKVGTILSLGEVMPLVQEALPRERKEIEEVGASDKDSNLF